MDKIFIVVFLLLILLIVLKDFLLYIEIKRMFAFISSNSMEKVKVINKKVKNKDIITDRKKIKARNLIKKRILELEHEKALRNYKQDTLE